MNLLLIHKVKLIVVVILCVLAVSFNCHAEEVKLYKSWTTTEIVQEVVWQGLHVVDWGQTRDIAKRPDEYYEKNTWLGEHPSVDEVNQYMIISAVLHLGISWVLPNNIEFKVFDYSINPRTIWQCITIVGTASTVSHNHSIGLRMNF